MAKTKSAPKKGYGTVTTYLSVKGVESVLAFAAKAFGAKLVYKLGNPGGGVMHAEISVGDTRLMLGEACPEHGPPMPAALYMIVPDCDGVYKKALKAGGKSVMKPAMTFYGHRASCVQDKGGNRWTIAAVVEKLSTAEIKKRAAKMMKK